MEAIRKNLRIASEIKVGACGMAGKYVTATSRAVTTTSTTKIRK